MIFGMEDPYPLLLSNFAIQENLSAILFNAKWSLEWKFHTLCCYPTLLSKKIFQLFYSTLNDLWNERFHTLCCYSTLLSKKTFHLLYSKLNDLWNCKGTFILPKHLPQVWHAFSLSYTVLTHKDVFFFTCTELLLSTVLLNQSRAVSCFLKRRQSRKLRVNVCIFK
jgi:hypothetical protein